MRTLLAILLWFGAGVVTAAEVPAELHLGIGDAKVLRLDLRRAALGDGSIVSLSSPEPGQLLVIAEAPGTTTAQLWLRDGSRRELRLVVSDDDPARRLLEVARLLDEAPSIRPRLVAGRILLEGTGASTADQQRAAAVAALYPGQVLDFVSRVNVESMIQFETRVVEIRRDGLAQLGIRWSASAEGPYAQARIGAGPDSFAVGLLSTLTSQIDLLEQRGMARTIAEPVLSCRSGGVARFISGGEVPLPVTDGLGATDVQYKEYGIILEVRPQATTQGPISAEVDVELSQIDTALRVRDFPGFVKRRSSTTVNVMAGETIVLAGLLASESTTDRQGLPGLGRLPVAGRLFSSKRQQQRQTELLVLLTPRRVVLDSTQAGAPATDQTDWTGRLQRLTDEVTP